MPKVRLMIGCQDKSAMFVMVLDILPDHVQVTHLIFKVLHGINRSDDSLRPLQLLQPVLKTEHKRVIKQVEDSHKQSLVKQILDMYLCANGVKRMVTWQLTDLIWLRSLDIKNSQARTLDKILQGKNQNLVAIRTRVRT